jgi:uncharacterized protein (TIGR03437 family)
MPALRNIAFLFAFALLPAVCPQLAARQIVTRTLIASLDTGSLAGTKFPVSFSYDADQVNAQGESYIALESFDFILLGVAFSRNDIFQGGQAIFRAGVLEDVTASFQVRLPPNSFVNNITFGFGGYGVIGYVDRLNAYGNGSFAFTAVAAIANAASFDRGALAPGALATIIGAGLAQSPAAAENGSLPFSLVATSVSVGNLPAPVEYVSPGQINFQIPWQTPPGPTTVAVSVNGVAAPALPAIIALASPGIFSVPLGSAHAAAVNLDGTLVAQEGSISGWQSHPAEPGDIIVIFATGLGAVTPPLGDGQIPADRLRYTVLAPKVMIAGGPAEVQFSGLSPQFPGLNQINVVVPQAPSGIVSIQIETAGVLSNELTIAVGSGAHL